VLRLATEGGEGSPLDALPTLASGRETKKQGEEIMRAKGVFVQTGQNLFFNDRGQQLRLRRDTHETVEASRIQSSQRTGTLAPVNQRLLNLLLQLLFVERKEVGWFLRLQAAFNLVEVAGNPL
jgi:hypothetical protein